jgi:RES domain-containing protein
MRLYRIVKRKHAYDLSGMGAKINGGRWNHEGIACVYLSENRALSLLEYTAHTGKNTLPPTLCFTTVEVPEHSMRTLSEQQLPANWMQLPHSRENRDFGSSLLTENNCLLIKLPSPLINQEFSFVLNPLHPLIHSVQITDVTSFTNRQ